MFGLDTLRIGAYHAFMKKPKNAAPAAKKAAPRGRPRSERAQRSILQAARSLLEEGGYAAATTEAIAARAGVAKTTIYRWWPNRAALLVDLLVTEANVVAPPPEKGDGLQALRKELKGATVAINGLTGRLLTSLLGEAQTDPAVRDALLTRLFYLRTAHTAGAIRRAQEAGDVRTDVPSHLAVDLFFGPLFYRMFVQHEPVNESFVKQVFQYVLEGLRPRTSGRK
jgi:AcrR family transcriptional regulator